MFLPRRLQVEAKVLKRSAAARRRRLSRRGMTFVYLSMALVVLMGLSSLAVDYGRVMMTKSELQSAADAAARYGASGLKNILSGSSAASANAVAAAANNIADGQAVVLDPNNDVQLVIWDNATRSYAVTTDAALANAVRVTARRTAARGSAVPLVFGQVLGKNACDVTASAIAYFTTGNTGSVTVPATSNPFLSGMPPGSVASMNNPHNNPDYAGTSAAPRQSPVFADGVNVTPGKTMTFDGINGNATNDFNDSNRYTADGNLGLVVNNTNGSENGISDVRAPINCLVGVFLSDSQPNYATAPASLDFSTDAARDFSTLKPQLQQMFFIGDGRNSSGEVQQFVIPPGATRLYVATWDSYEWNNNVGSFSFTYHNTGTITLVN